MITDEDETVVGFNIDLNSDLGFQEEDDEEGFMCASNDQPMLYQDELIQDEDFCGEDKNVYQELAEKDHYLLLAAEAGKVLLEKNQELSDQYSKLQDEYIHKIESLEEERHHLKRELHERDYNYESRMQDLQHELSHMRGQLTSVQKASKNHEQNSKTTLHDLSYQNNSLLQELDQVKSYNQELANKVQTLSRRIDGRLNGGSGSNKRVLGMFPDYDGQDGKPGDDESEETQLDYVEMKRLREKVQRLAEEKRLLEESFTEVVQEKAVVHTEHQTTVTKMSVLENELLSLKQQVGIYQEDLHKTKKKNNKLKDKLEEITMIQSHNTTPPSPGNSLFNELEMSLSEADMNLRHNSTPLKSRTSDGDDDDVMSDEGVPDILVTTPNNREINRITSELREVYNKLNSLKRKLKDEDDLCTVDFDDDVITAEMISRLVDQVVVLIQERILSLGIIDPRTESPRASSENGEETCSITESRLSDTEVDLLEQQLSELNHLLNERNAECSAKKKELNALQASVFVKDEKLDMLEVQVNKQDREIGSLRQERDILLSDKTMEEKLKQVLEERDEAIKRANELQANEEQHTSDMKKLNTQLIAAVQQKIELSEQLEEWQFDMASLIDQQLSSQIKNEQKRSRKRANSGSRQQQQQQQNVKSYLSRFFSRKSSNANTRESSQATTPSVQSPVPPK